MSVSAGDDGGGCGRFDGRPGAGGARRRSERVNEIVPRDERELEEEGEEAVEAVLLPHLLRVVLFVSHLDLFAARRRLILLGKAAARRPKTTFGHRLCGILGMFSL